MKTILQNLLMLLSLACACFGQSVGWRNTEFSWSGAGLVPASHEVRGYVSCSGDNLRTGDLQLRRQVGIEDGSNSERVYATSVRPQGRFEFEWPMPPGQYDLVARYECGHKGKHVTQSLEIRVLPPSLIDHCRTEELIVDVIDTGGDAVLHAKSIPRSGCF